jgi:hypothetical protein
MGPSDRNDPQSRAQAVFTASEQRDKSVRADIEKERAATDAKTARLKALRLAKEAEDAANEVANPKPVAVKAAKKSVKKKTVKV